MCVGWGWRVGGGVDRNLKMEGWKYWGFRNLLPTILFFFGIVFFRKRLGGEFSKDALLLHKKLESDSFC